MFYAHLEGRKTFITRSIERGLKGACYNMVYPPDLDDVANPDFQILVNPQSFRLTYPKSTWSPKVMQILRSYDQLTVDKLAVLDINGRATRLTDRGREICDDFLQAQEALNATDIIAPYYAAASVRDPLLDISILSSLYLEEQTDKPVFCGVMLDAEVLSSTSDFDELANFLSAPNPPFNYYFDLSLNSSPKRPLRNPNTLSILKLLFDALKDAEKYSLLARCNIEGLLLRAVTGLDAFSSSYFQSERQAIHGRLNEDYVALPAQMRAPTPYLFSPALMTDIPRPLVQRLLSEGREDLFICECGECAKLVEDIELPLAARRAPIHYVASMTTLDEAIDRVQDLTERAELMLNWIEFAESKVDELGRAAVPAGTFTHLGQWRSWIEDQIYRPGDE